MNPPGTRRDALTAALRASARPAAKRPGPAPPPSHLRATGITAHCPLYHHEQLGMRRARGAVSSPDGHSISASSRS